MAPAVDAASPYDGANLIAPGVRSTGAALPATRPAAIGESVEALGELPLAKLTKELNNNAKKAKKRWAMSPRQSKESAVRKEGRDQGMRAERNAGHADQGLLVLYS